MKNSCSPLAPHPASFAPPWGLAGEVCPSSVWRLLSGPRLCLSPTLLGSDGFFLSPVPALKGTRPLPRAHACTHSPLTSLVRSPLKPSAFPPPPRSLCQGPGRPQAPSHSQRQEPREVQPTASWAQRHLPGTRCVPSSVLQGGWGRQRVGGWGRQLSAGKGSQTPGGEGEMAAQPSAVGWSRSCSPEAPRVQGQLRQTVLEVWGLAVRDTSSIVG